MLSSAAKNVFIVEDSVPVRARLVEMVCDIQGVSVVGEAETLEHAVSGILRTLPDYVLLDFQLKIGTGEQVLRAVRTQVPKTVFIVLTNHTEIQFRQVCVDAGADAFFDKSSEIAKVKELLVNGLAVRGKQH